MNFLKKPWSVKPGLGAQVNYGHPLAQNLVGCFLLNEGAGTTTRNLVSGYQYAFQGTPTWNYKQGGLGLDSTPSNDDGIVGSVEDRLKLTSVASILIRVLPIGTPTGSDAIALFGVTNNSSYTTPLFGYGICLAFGASQLVTAVWNAGGSQQASAGSAYSTFSKNQEHQFLLTINTEGGSGQTFMYSDNAKLETSGSGGGSAMAYGSGPRLVIGTDPGASGKNIQSSFLAGYIWNRQVSKAECSWLWSEPYAFFEYPRRKTITFGISTGVSQALSSKVESISELKTSTLYKSFGIGTILESESYIIPALTKPVSLPSSIIESASGISAELQKPKHLTSIVESSSEFITGISKFLGALKLSVTLKPLPLTSYIKSVPRPIAYLKNDNYNVGSTTEDVEISPADGDLT